MKSVSPRGTDFVERIWCLRGRVRVGVEMQEVSKLSNVRVIVSTETELGAGSAETEIVDVAER